MNTTTTNNPAEARFRLVAFMQGHEADTVGDIIEAEGIEAGIRHMAQWDNGEAHEPTLDEHELVHHVGFGTFYEADIPGTGIYIMHRQHGGINYSLYAVEV